MKHLFSILLLTIACWSFGQKVNKTISKVKLDSLKLVLEDMVDKDQNIRRILVDSIGPDSPNAGPYISQMMDIDDEIQKKLLLILDNYGWIERIKLD